VAYFNSSDFHHGHPERLGVLVVNLGTPDAPSRGAVRRYLAEFLSDPRVVEMSRPLWWLILHGVILRIRPARSAHAYQQIWTPEGSPLLQIALRQADALGQALRERAGGPIEVALAMRYGNPSIRQALRTLAAANVRRLLVLPLYPQYSATTTGSVFDAVTAELRTWRWVPETRFVNQYHDHPGYIDALAASIDNFWAAQGQAERLLFSFHGIPEAYFRQGDPYFCHCQKTARLVVERLGLARDRWQLSFQSRVGRQTWLQPYTDHQLGQWGREGVKSVQVVCPGFSADCLETLEEIAMTNRALFLAAGGRDYAYIPALNEEPAHIQTLADLVERHSHGWPEGQAGTAPDPNLRDREARARRARAMGAAN
jgi:ferrochelatase